jgi:hypothetical protein
MLPWADRRLLVCHLPYHFPVDSGWGMVVCGWLVVFTFHHPLTTQHSPLFLARYFLIILQNFLNIFLPLFGDLFPDYRVMNA